MTDRPLKPESRLVHAGRSRTRFEGAVNPPVYHMSTVLTPSVEDFDKIGTRRSKPGAVVYGRFGTPTHHALEQALSDMEGGADTLLLPSGVAAIVTAFLTVAGAGDHLLVSDAVYLPTRKCCEGFLRRYGIAVSYFDPLIEPEHLARLIRPETKGVFFESPASSTFEVQDVPALATVARDAGLAVLMDNTWATPLHFRPLEHGVDLSIQAATKYIVGHSDAMLGSVTANERWAPELRARVQQLGSGAGPDDVYLALRGLRTLSARLERHARSALQIAEWLRGRPEVAQVLYPALPDHPQHERWRRDFDGASGLFGVVLAEPCPPAAIAAMIDGYRLFGIGASWGGYESLSIPIRPDGLRSTTAWPFATPLVRYHIGLEHPDDLIADLEAGFARLARASGTG